MHAMTRRMRYTDAQSHTSMSLYTFIEYAPNRNHLAHQTHSEDTNVASEIKNLLWYYLNRANIPTRTDLTIWADFQGDQKSVLKLRVDLAVFGPDDELMCLIETANGSNKWYRRGRRQYRYRSLGVPVFLCWEPSQVESLIKRVKQLNRNHRKARLETVEDVVSMLSDRRTAQRAGKRAKQGYTRRTRTLNLTTQPA